MAINHLQRGFSPNQVGATSIMASKNHDYLSCCGMGISRGTGIKPRDTMSIKPRNNFPTGFPSQARRGAKSAQFLWWCVTGRC